MRLTSGFILHVDDKILACHATGRPWENGNYDIPKGLVEEGEDPLETAIRELREETGIVLSEYKYNIKDLGEYPYLKDKRIHIFDLHIDNFDMSKELICESMFEDKDGSMKPEMNGYKWTETIDLFYPSLKKVIERNHLI